MLTKSTSEPPAQTERFKTVLRRLKNATIGVFTFNDLKLMEWAVDIERQMASLYSGEFTLYRQYNDEGDLLMREYRDTRTESDRLEALERLADKAGV